MASLQDALAWAGRGFRIFPLTPMAKTPAIKAFESFATTDAGVITAWWRDPVTLNEYDYNIGVLCNDMVVVDVDNKEGRNGFPAFENIGDYDTLVVDTPSGGIHAYYYGPDSKLAVDLMPGIDIRSHNGYVLAPGSYIVDPETGVIGEYTIRTDHGLAWVPTEIETLLEPPGTRRAHDLGVDLDTPVAIEQATQYLTVNAEIAVEGGGGDIVTYRVAAKLVRDYALSPETAFELMLRHWNERCEPRPWPPDMLWRKVQNADEYATGQTGQALAGVVFEGVTVPPVPQAMPTGPILLPGTTWGNAIDPSVLIPRPWLVERLLMNREITILAGDGAAGKSLAGLIIAAHLACGKVLGSYRFTMPRKSVVFNGEDDIEEQSRRLSAICTAYGLDWYTVKSNLLLLDMDTFPIMLVALAKFDLVQNDDQVRELIDMIAPPDVGLLILDPLVQIHSVDENNQGHMNFVMRSILRLIRAGNVAGLIMHHTQKANSRTDNRAGEVSILRGASAIPNAARAVITLVNPSEKDREELGLAPNDRYDYVRLDDGKQSRAKRNASATWFKWDTILLQQGDTVGVLRQTSMRKNGDAQRDTIASILMQAMQDTGVATYSLQEACQKLSEYDPLYGRMSISERRRRVAYVLTIPVKIGEATLTLHRETVSGKNHVNVVLT